MITGLHLEPTNLCTLKCEGCARTIFQKQWMKHWKNHSIDIEVLDRFLDVDLNGVLIYLCGNYGDPIYHPRFVSLVEQLKSRGAHLKITTNGSYKTRTWWESLSNALTAQDTIEFSIDGMPNTFTQYRENANWDSIQVGIDSMVQSAARTVWKFIPFAFNSEQVETTRQFSAALGFDEFLLDRSDRYEEHLVHLKPEDPELIHPRYQGRNTATEIDAKCASGNMHYISADGYYAACCFIADHRYLYKSVFGKQRDRWSIHQHSLGEILEQSYTREFFESIAAAPPQCCTMNCPKAKK